MNEEQDIAVTNVGLRDFQRNMYTHLKSVDSMPVILTKNGDAAYVVMTYETHCKQKDIDAKQSEMIGLEIFHREGQPTFWQKAWRFLNTKIF